MMMAVALALTSCLKNDADNAETITYNETAITSFSLTAVNRYIHTTSKAGTDSVYKRALVVKDYPFSIDQYQRKIYNTDSLPADCDLKHVLASIGKSTYSGDIFIKTIVGDTLRVYSSTDSIDFSQAREVQVYNSSLERHRSYTVQVNVKKSADTGLFQWEKMDDGDTSMPKDIQKEMRVDQVGKDGFRLTLDGGNTWSQETLGTEEDWQYMPTGIVNYVTFPLDPQHNTAYHLMTGRLEGNDYMSTVWRKITVDGKGSWTCMLNLPLNADTQVNYPGRLPADTHIDMVYNDRCIYAFLYSGGIYVSKDQGLSWQTATNLNLPSGATDHLRVAEDEEGYIWLLKEDGEGLWRGWFK